MCGRDHFAYGPEVSCEPGRFGFMCGANTNPVSALFPTFRLGRFPVSWRAGPGVARRRSRVVPPEHPSPRRNGSSSAQPLTLSCTTPHRPRKSPTREPSVRGTAGDRRSHTPRSLTAGLSFFSRRRIPLPIPRSKAEAVALRAQPSENFRLGCRYQLNFLHKATMRESFCSFCSKKNVREVNDGYVRRLGY
ncbi:hypothetical protein BH11PLA2_BH11PLA2_22510 [soil metagenome]